MQQWVDSQLIIHDLINVAKNESATIAYTDLEKMDVKLHEIFLTELQQARVYEIDGRVARMFALTLNKPRQIELPFSSLFLNTNIKFKGTEIHGISIQKWSEAFGLKGRQPTQEDWLIRAVYTKPKGGAIKWGQPATKSDVGVLAIQLNQTSEEDETQNKERGGNICSILRRIVMNFNDFLEHPEIVIREHQRTNQEKRAKRGKLPLPNSTVVAVKGELCIYVDSIQPKEQDEEDISKCVEVAGHWRRFRHPRFTNKQGQKTFIHPYIKGAGSPEIKRRIIPLTKLKRVEYGA